MALRDNLLFGMGNPLLDISCNVEKPFLEKYGLEENNAILADEAKHLPMFDEMSKMAGVEYIAGGATQNSFRVASWVLGRKNVGTFIGCVGNDEYGNRLKSNMEDAGVRTEYQINEKVKTGTCAVCINGNNRSLVAHLAAANEYSKDHLLDVPANWSLVEGADFYYISGFFLTVCPDAITAIGKHASEKNKVFVHNLSAPFICQFFKEPQAQVMPYVDILIGNEDEAAAYSEAHAFGTKDLKEIATRIQSSAKSNESRPRTVIITHGAEQIIVANKDGVKTYAVPKMESNQIIDTNGAGDAFVGGFLAQYIQGKDMDECVRCGIWAAQTIIARSGCTFPEKCDFQ